MRLSKNTKGSEAEGRMQRLTDVKELVKAEVWTSRQQLLGAGSAQGFIWFS